jgi:hypothetical protein
MGVRTYNYGYARFTQPDPRGSSVTDLNRYAYAGCNPANFIDPTGTQFFDPTTQCEPFALGIGIGLFTIGIAELSLSVTSVASGEAVLFGPFGIGLAAAGALSGAGNIFAGIDIARSACE